jgi:hypothetical protein
MLTDSLVNIDAGRLEQDFGLEFHRPLGRGGVGRHERAAGACRQDNDPPLFQMPLGPPANVRLGHAVHGDRRHDPRFAAQRLQSVLQRQGVDHRGEHPHVVGGRFLNVRVRPLELRPAEDVAAADDQRDLTPRIRRLLHLPGDVDDLLHADSPLAGMAEALAGELKDDAFEGADWGVGAGHVDWGFLVPKLPLGNASFSKLRFA